jgi:alpha-galactosidase
MIETLENASLQLKVDTTLSRWSLTSRQRHSPSLDEVQVSAHFRQGYFRHQALNHWPSPSFSSPQTIDSPHGPLTQLCLQMGPDRLGLSYTLTFALPELMPMLLFKLAVDNRGGKAVQIERLEPLSAGFIYQSRPGPRGSISFGGQPDCGHKTISIPQANRRQTGDSLFSLPGNYAFYANGWQSWSDTRVYSPSDRFQHSHLGPLRAPIVANPGTPRPNRTGLFASDMFGVIGDRTQRTGILAAFLSQKQHFGSLEAWIGEPPPALRLWANGDRAQLLPGNQVETDWACVYFLHLDTHDPLGPYLDAVARENRISPEAQASKRPPAGWCSWYQFYRDVSAEDIRTNLVTATELKDDLPLKVIQIDDGFERQVGDWFSTTDRFPDDIAPLASEIRSEGFDPGLWLAPFLVSRDSNLAREHPDWLLRGRLGRLVNAGYLWGAFQTALDLTHPGAITHVRDLIRTAVEGWGYSYLKLDFLYAAALPGRFSDPTQTRAQVLRVALQAVRDAAGEETFLLGCGCPLGPAVGLMDGMRIGPDIAHRWEPRYRGIAPLFKNETDLPSARNAIRNTLTRASLHGRWWINDPDVLLLPDGNPLQEETELTQPEFQSLAALIALSGGSLFLSDHLPDLPAESLKLAETLLPVIGKRPHILDWFDSSMPTHLQLDLSGAAGEWHLIALFNWSDRIQDIPLHLEDFYLDPQEDYWAREFWGGEIYALPARTSGEASCVFPDIPPHGNLLLALRPQRKHAPQFLGSSLHISQGLEVAGWHWEGGASSPKGQLTMQLERPGQAGGQVALYLPVSPHAAWLDGNPVSLQPADEHLYHLEVAFNRQANLILNL